MSTDRTPSLLAHVLIYGGAFVWFGASHGLHVALLFAGPLVWASIVDLETYEIPDAAVALLLVGGLARAALVSPEAAAERLLAAAFWAAAFWSIAELYKRRRGWDGLGFGDVKLIAGVAAWLGLQGTVAVVLTAATSGVLFLLTLGLVRSGAPSPGPRSVVAFGPFLCLPAWILWLNEGAP